MKENAVKYSLYSVLIKLSILLMTILYLLMGYRDFLVVVNSTIFGQVIFDLYLLFKYKDLFNFSNFNFDKPLCIRMAKFGFPLMVSVFLSSFLNTSGRFFLGTYSTYYELGIFTAATKVAGLLSIIQTSFTSFWLPTAYRWNKEKKEMADYILVSEGLCFFLSIIILVIIFFKNFVVIFISPDYLEAKYILPLMCLPPLLFTLSETTTLGIVFSRKSYLNILVGVLSLFPCILLNMYLIPIYGTKGAAFSQAVGFLLFYFLRSFFSKITNFDVSNFRQKIIVLLMFIVCFLNLFQFSNLLIINIAFLIILIFIQIPIVKKIIKTWRSVN